MTVGTTVLVRGDRAQLRRHPRRRRSRAADGRRPARAPSSRSILPAGEDVAGRLPPAVHHAGRPPGRGLDRRRSAGSGQPPLAGRAGPRVARTSSWSTATSSPSRTRPRPTTWPRRCRPARSRRASRGRSGWRSSPSRSSRVASWPPTTWSSCATSPSSVQPRSRPSTIT